MKAFLLFAMLVAAVVSLPAVDNNNFTLVKLTKYDDRNQTESFCPICQRHYDDCVGYDPDVRCKTQKCFQKCQAKVCTNYPVSSQTQFHRSKMIWAHLCVGMQDNEVPHLRTLRTLRQNPRYRLLP